MSTYSLIVFIHVVAGVVLIGSSLSTLFLRAALRRAQTVGQLRSWLSLTQASGRIDPIAAMVLLATGIYLGVQGWWNTGWFVASVGLWLVNSLYGARTTGRALGHLAEACAKAGGEQLSAEIDSLRRSRSLELAADVMLGGDLAVLFLMTNKPGPVGSLVTVVLAQAIVHALRWVHSSRTQAPVTLSGAPVVAQSRQG